MKRKIYKYTILTQDKQTVLMPKDAEILSCQAQGNEVCIWALVEPELEKEPRHIEIFGTGHEIHYDMGTDREFIDTYQLSLPGGIFVGHVFERIN